MTYAWCLSCGQSFEAAELGPKWCCIWCDAPAERLIAADRPITPPVVNGKPLAFSVLVRSSDKPKYISLAIPQAVKRREFREDKSQRAGQWSPRPRRREASPRPWGAPAQLLDLRAGECRFPLTDDPPHLFCGDRAQAGCSWCAEHARIVYAPLAAKREANLGQKEAAE